MALTALHDGVVLDSTSVPEPVWAQLYRPRRPAPLACRGCEGAMHAKVSSRGLRFFAHNARDDACAWAAESPEHQRLKALIAGQVRALGFTAEVEASPTDGDRTRWRADVLASGVNGIKIAFEVQLSPITAAECVYRTERYAADGITTVWITTKRSGWVMTRSTMVLAPDDATTCRQGAVRVKGSEVFHARDVPVSRLVDGLLRGRVVPAGPYLGEHVLVAAADAHRLPDLSRLKIESLEVERRHSANAPAPRPPTTKEKKPRPTEPPAAFRLRGMEQRRAERPYDWDRRRGVGERATAASRMAAHFAEHVHLDDGEQMHVDAPPRPWTAGWEPAALFSSQFSHGHPVWAVTAGAVPRLLYVMSPIPGPGVNASAPKWHAQGVKIAVPTARDARAMAMAVGTELSANLIVLVTATGIDTWAALDAASGAPPATGSGES